MMIRYMITRFTISLLVILLVTSCSNTVKDEYSESINKESINPVSEEKIYDLIIIDDSENWMIYNDEKFEFSIKYPSLWTSKAVETWEATETQEASPDSGIYLYPNGNEDEYVYLYAQNGKINILPLSGYERLEFKTFNGNKGSYYELIENNIVSAYLLMDEGHHGAILNMKVESYLEHKEKILNVLATLEMNS